MKGELIQDVRTPSGTTHPKGTVVYSWGRGFTGGIIDYGEVAVTLEEDQTPFFGVPENAIEWQRDPKLVLWLKELGKKLTNLF